MPNFWCLYFTWFPSPYGDSFCGKLGKYWCDTPNGTLRDRIRQPQPSQQHYQAALALVARYGSIPALKLAESNIAAIQERSFSIDEL